MTTPPTNPGSPTNTERLVDENATSDDRTYAMILHLSILAHLATAGLGIVVALIMWLVKKGESPFIDDHGREALNFQITLIGYYIIAAIVIVPLALLTCGVGAILGLAPIILAIVGMIQAASAANRGEFYRYPATIRFLH